MESSGGGVGDKRQVKVARDELSASCLESQMRTGSIQAQSLRLDAAVEPSYEPEPMSSQCYISLLRSLRLRTKCASALGEYLETRRCKAESSQWLQ